MSVSFEKMLTPVQYQPRGRRRTFNQAVIRAASAMLGRSRSNAAIGAAGAALSAGVAGFRALKRRKVPYSKTTAIFRDDGNHPGKKLKVRKIKRNVKKRSLKTRIKALEKNTPKLSTVYRKNSVFEKMDIQAINEKRYFAVHMQTMNQINTASNGLSLAADNRQAMVKNCKCVLKMKNARTSNVQVRYQMLKCSGNTDTDPLTLMRQWCIERGVTITNAVSTAVAATATSSYVPIRLALPAGEQFISIFPSKNELNEWKPEGSMQSIVLAPGDTFDVTYNSGQFLYRKEDVSNADAGTVYYKGLDTFCIVEIHGQQGHDETNTTNIGISPVSLDCHKIQTVLVAAQDGLGARTWQHADADTNEGLTTLVHVDNMASAVEIADT